MAFVTHKGDVGNMQAQLVKSLSLRVAWFDRCKILHWLNIPHDPTDYVVRGALLAPRTVLAPMQEQPLCVVSDPQLSLWGYAYQEICTAHAAH